MQNDTLPVTAMEEGCAVLRKQAPIQALQGLGKPTDVLQTYHVCAECLARSNLEEIPAGPERQNSHGMCWGSHQMRNLSQDESILGSLFNQSK